jgi:hypothetical protein
MGKPRWHAFYKAEKSDQSSLPSLTDIRALSIVVWRQGFKRNTRFRFWKSLAIIAMRNPKLLEQFLVVLAHNEHFQEYRGVVTKEIQDQMAALPLDPAVSATETNSESNRELQTV